MLRLFSCCEKCFLWNWLWGHEWRHKVVTQRYQTRLFLQGRDIVLFFSYTVHGLWLYSIVRRMLSDNRNDKNTPQPFNHSFFKPQRRMIIIPGWRSGLCSGESALSYFLGSLVFQMEEINCMACWWAPEMPFLFWFKATENSLLHITENC